MKRPAAARFECKASAFSPGRVQEWSADSPVRLCLGTASSSSSSNPSPPIEDDEKDENDDEAPSQFAPKSLTSTFRTAPPVRRRPKRRRAGPELGIMGPPKSRRNGP